MDGELRDMSQSLSLSSDKKSVPNTNEFPPQEIEHNETKIEQISPIPEQPKLVISRVDTGNESNVDDKKEVMAPALAEETTEEKTFYGHGTIE
ncbi:hypothetical protein LSH36_1280g00091 [Paralvinella palmiformis]|uniref:Uncharacterized protein n=1 Tax=Paralvinella palmiformis TaxID=53620 RepID=A0AAD9MNU3_9ANNE|nr:hypothetical protein LSH36_1280g00091 [Paralvinella palmiformis]